MGLVSSFPSMAPSSLFTATLFGMSLAGANNIPSICPNIVKEKLHPLEKRVLGGVLPSVMIEDGFPFNYFKHFLNNENREDYLRFCRDDKRDKFLFLSSQDSHGFSAGMGAEIPKFKLLSDINQKFDLKFKVVQSYDEICDEVKKAAKVGKLANVLIDANGDSEKVCLSEYIHCLGETLCSPDIPRETFCNSKISLYGYDQSDKVCKIYDTACGPNGVCNATNIDINERQDLKKCFKGLDPNGKIILLSNLAGAPDKKGNYKQSIAQKIATAAKRAVIAPVDWFIYRTEMPNVEDFEVFHPASTNLIDMFRRGKSIYKLFQPVYKNCVELFKDKIHAREQSAIDVVKDETAKKSTLIQPEKFDDLQDLLRFCKDDPKQKFLYLSMESNEEEEGALHPRFYPKILEPLSKEYDIKFKVVKSYGELCTEVKESAKIGDLVNIIINGHGNPFATHISGDQLDKNKNIIWDNFLHIYRADLAKCFEGADLSKITLFSCSTSAPLNGDPKNNIAHKVAGATKGTVVAPLEDIFPVLIKLESVNPFEVYHPSECDKYGRCKSDVDTFQTIESKKKP